MVIGVGFVGLVVVIIVVEWGYDVDFFEVEF